MRCLIIDKSVYTSILEQILKVVIIDCRITKATTKIEAQCHLKNEDFKYDLIVLEPRLFAYADLSFFIKDATQTPIPVLLFSDSVELARTEFYGASNSVGFLYKDKSLLFFSNTLLKTKSISTKHLPLEKQSHPPEIKLTKKQRELADLIVSGHSNKEISALLCISESTAKNYVFQLTRLFDVTSRGKLSAKLRGNGFEEKIKTTSFK
jgi:DNA-binding CsgD family transcriptional regulator